MKRALLVVAAVLALAGCKPAAEATLSMTLLGTQSTDWGSDTKLTAIVDVENTGNVDISRAVLIAIFETGSDITTATHEVSVDEGALITVPITGSVSGNGAIITAVSLDYRVEDHGEPDGGIF